MFNPKDCLAFFKFLLLAVCFQASSVSIADDTEIYFSSHLTDANPNVMFVLDVSGSMDDEAGDSGKTRFESMKSALESVIDGASSNVNVGLMNFGELPWRNEAHGVKFPVKPIDSLVRPVVVDELPEHDDGSLAWVYSNLHEPSETVTVRSYLSEMTDWYWKNSWYEVQKEGDSLKNTSHSGATPIVSALFEAAKYFRGERVTFGVRNLKQLDGTTEDLEGYAHHSNRWAAHPSTYHGPLIGDKCGTTTTKIRDKGEGISDWFKCPAKIGDETSPGAYENCEINKQCEVVSQVRSVCETKSRDVKRCNKKGQCSWKTEYYQECEDKAFEVEQCSYEVCNEDQGSVLVADYKSPISEVCQNNYIVLLSDGQPTSYKRVSTSDGSYLTFIEGPVYTGLKDGTLSPLTDKSGGTNVFNAADCESNPTPSGYKSGICGPELTHFLANSDNSDVAGTQTINTFAIGFDLSDDESATSYLKSLVTADDPDTTDVEGFFAVENEEALSSAFAKILENVTATTSSYASPGYSIDMKNGIHNEDYIYIPVFDKQLAPRWNGNLKKFKLTKSVKNGVTVTSITDKYGKVAVNEFGVFEDTAVDFWSNSSESTPDGISVVKGGMRSLIDPVNRLAVTDVACSGTSTCDLSNSNNLINEDNTQITATTLGLDSSADQDEIETLINFARGRKVNSKTGEYESVPHVGDMLHTEPVIVTYNANHASLAESSNGYHQQVIFSATNEGYLHAVDTRSGKELFAFMPSSLMKNMKKQYDNSDLGNHAYGIDGVITTWVHDENKDGVITPDDGDYVYLYFGLRRGGREYYALDVTNPLSPKLKWNVDGATDSEFSTLGQTWSTPYLAKIRVNASSAAKEVAIFTGGYDLNQDIEDPQQRSSSDSVGNDIFIVDAKTGALLWSAQNGGSLGGSLSNKSLLTHSIPGGARLLDMNQDGAVDRMYFADTSGQVFRLELPIGPSYGFSEAKLIKFADLGGSDTSPRMFYNEPDVAMFSAEGKSYLSVSIGTGYRAHPANMELTDRFYVLIDGAVYSTLENKLNSTESFATLTESDLVQVTATGGNTIGSINPGNLNDKTILEVDGKSGWYFVMPEDGEKVLATSVTAQGNVLFTTLVPHATADSMVGDICGTPQTQGRYYSMNILTAQAGSDLNDDGVITDADLMLIVSENEIPGSPQRIFNEPVCTADECSQFVDIRVGKRNSALEEHDVSRLESVFWTDPE